MSENNNSSSSNWVESTTKKSKVKTLLPAVVLVTSLYYSMSFTAGIVIGYILCRLFCHFFLHNGKIERVFVDFGKWKLHLHHWIGGVVVLAIVWVIDFFYMPTFLTGFVCGIIIQDIYDYNDWYKVIVKNEETVR